MDLYERLCTYRLLYIILCPSTCLYTRLRPSKALLCPSLLIYTPLWPLSAALGSSEFLYGPLQTSMYLYTPLHPCMHLYAPPHTSMPLSGHLGPSAAPLCPFKGLFCTSLLFYITLWPNTLLYIPLGHFIASLHPSHPLLAPIDSSMALYAPLCSPAFLYTHLHAS